MLQQTQASRIAERFDAFMDRYPSPQAMAAVPPAAVLAAWSGLGYNRRALHLHAAAIRISSDGWPTTVAELEALPGIGAYSARAIASIALGQPVGAVDTNVRRWLVRRLGAAPSDRAGLQRLANGLAASAAHPAPEETAAWTHATMEFGARVCTARNPRCGACPVSRGCPSRVDPPHVAVPRQSAATASTRAARGALLRALSAAPNHRLSDARARKTVEGMVSAADFGSFTARLEQDGLLHRSGRAVVLGPPPQGE
jgi:A/G-specific adenine glycosylase